MINPPCLSRISSALLFSLAMIGCAAPTAKQQAFPALNTHIERQVKSGRTVAYPALLHSVKPTYPSLPAAGSVWAVMKVTPEGNVDEVKTVGPAPELYQEAIQKALLQWRFRPGTVDSQPTTFPMQVKVTFEGRSDKKVEPEGDNAEKGIQMHTSSWITRSVFPDLERELELLHHQGKDIQRPEVVKTWTPPHPNPNAAGSVWVAFVINAQAKPERIHIIGDAPQEFQDTIADAIKKWKFKSAKVDGRPYPFPAAGQWTFKTRQFIMVK